MESAYQSMSAHLLPGEAMRRRDRNRAYMMRLTSENLLRSHYLEAGLIGMSYKPENIHWGWDAPTSEIRGTICGHWLSAAAHMYTDTKDEELLAKANHIVREIARCQEANGGLWAFPIPEKYLYWLKSGKHPWAPQYVCHKNMMGLLDMYRFAGNEQALDIARKCADWFYTFTGDITREQMSDMMDLEETGGMMEYWADLYAVTGDEKHLALMRRYERPRLADPLLKGVDMLTNMHANATIPEIQGYARAYEITGERGYRSVVEAYWDMAVEKRGTFATGGQTSGEIWTPMGLLAARLGDKNQEHCVVYNMMRLSQALFRWTGEAKYADYWERNLYNGIFAQGYWEDETTETLGAPHERKATTVAYYLPMVPGAVKHWGSELENFWCCHGTLLQANAIHHESIYYRTQSGVAVAQYLASFVDFEWNGIKVRVTQTEDRQTGGKMMADAPVNRKICKRPSDVRMNLEICAEKPTAFGVRLRLPGWRTGDITVWINGEKTNPTPCGGGFVEINHVWHTDQMTVCIGKKLTCCSLPDEPDMVAFLDGPICLAGLVREEHLLYGDLQHPEGTLLCADDERQWQQWRGGWKTYRQPFGIRFKPLYQIGTEEYTLYFPVDEEKR